MSSPRQVFEAGKRCPYCGHIIDPRAKTCASHRPQIWRGRIPEMPVGLRPDSTPEDVQRYDRELAEYQAYMDRIPTV